MATKIDIISGFLGAGKTTFIQKLIREGFGNDKVVLIENEFGEIGIDGGFLKDSGIEMKEMNSGCICCSLVGDFGTSLKEVLDTYAPDRIVIEPSGVGKLSDVMKAVGDVCEQCEGVEIASAVTVVDASKCKMYSKNFGEFFLNQIESAGLVVLSRTGKMTQEKIDQAVAIVKEHNDHATVLTTPWDQLNGKQILDEMEEHKDLAADLMAEVQASFEEEEECCCGHHHDHDHEHHHHDGECCCGHDHDHEHHHHDEDHDDHDHEHHHNHEHHHHDDDEECPVCGGHHHHDEDHDDHEHEHHHDHEHHHHDDDEECPVCGGHHHHDEDHDDHDHEHHHDHDHHEHDHHHDHDLEHHHHDGECACGHDHHHHDHDHDHHHHHHHADEVFTSWGKETAGKYTEDEIRDILGKLDEGEYGIILRAKGMLPDESGSWTFFDFVPGEIDVRPGTPELTGKICVIGSKLKEDLLKELFAK